jgi:hypothetical protein
VRLRIVSYMKYDQRTLQARFAYREVFIITHKMGTPHPIIATPKKAEQKRVTGCT